MKAANKYMDKLLANPTPFNVMVLDKLLKIGIPFNAPHGYKVKSISRDAVLISLPNRKLNHNHLSGIHACSIATVGEFCAGLSLLSLFGISKYRLIMSELNVKYLYQGRTDLEGSCSPQQIDVEKVRIGLENDGKYIQILTTMIRDLNGKDVAEVTSTWQLKNWDQVKTKN
jgi:acyl-coenzyme A thioesterase PaaI-like protein